MQAVAESGACISGACAIHMNIFGLHPVVLFGTAAQKAHALPLLIAGRNKPCFAVTEPDLGLNTTQLKTRAERRGGRYVVHGREMWISTAHVANKLLLLLLLLLARAAPLERKTGGLSLFYTDINRRKVEVRLIEKMGRHAVDSNMVFFDGLEIRPRTGSTRKAEASTASCPALVCSVTTRSGAGRRASRRCWCRRWWRSGACWDRSRFSSAPGQCAR